MPGCDHAALAHRARIRAFLSVAGRGTGRLKTGSARLWQRLRAAWRARWLAWRNRRLADPDFQRRAGRRWPGRLIARRQTRALFDLCAGFVYSQVLLACVELDLFEHLLTSPATPTELAPRLALSEAATSRLLAAAASLQLAERLADGRYALGALGAAAAGNPAVAAMVRHHPALYADLADPVARLKDRERPGALRRFWAYADDDGRDVHEARTSDYTRLMADSQAMIAEQVIESCDFAGVDRLLDAGGGSGVFVERLLTRWPQIDAVVFDLPSVAAQAEARLAASPSASRIRCLGGDMRDPWPARDLQAVSFVRILHDHEDEAVRTLLARAYDALAPGGRVIVAEPLADTPGGEPIGAAYFGFYLWAMGQGRARTASEITALLAAAGFSGVRFAKPPNPLLASVVEAYRTAATDGN